MKFWGGIHDNDTLIMVESGCKSILFLIAWLLIQLRLEPTSKSKVRLRDGICTEFDGKYSQLPIIQVQWH